MRARCLKRARKPACGRQARHAVPLGGKSDGGSVAEKRFLLVLRLAGCRIPAFPGTNRKFRIESNEEAL